MRANNGLITTRRRDFVGCASTATTTVQGKLEAIGASMHRLVRVVTECLEERVKQQQDHLTQLTKAKAKAKPDPSKKAPAANQTSRLHSFVMS
eukprot:6466964-Amphidinium_carterae.1